MFVSDKARALFAQAQTMTPDARDQFITSACEGNQALFNEVDSLLRAAEGSEEFFSKIVSRMSLSAIANNDEPFRRGNVLGHWRLGKCIGRGGMGAVYLAERADDEFEKQAALKLLPFGTDSDAARERFLRERQILARLVHDNIARLLDGGVTDEGIPFFVMDYVEGQPIDDYCSVKGLKVDDKLALVLDITNALQYAHANLVVHRDLKPGNVLVEESGRVRLLDFGVAKTLDPQESESELTQLAQRPVTAAFASPEMLRGDPVDVTTDIYSTAVLAYLLLTGKLPINYEGLSVAESITRAETSVPAPASSLNPEVGVDLDTILAKAMAKTPRERYSSIDNLATDIRNYVAGRPVNANEPTRMYHFQKFVKRNSLAIFSSLAASVALVGLTAFALMQSAEANRQRDLAVLEQQRVQASNEFYGLLLEEMDAKPFTSVELLDRGAELLEKQYGIQEAFMGPIFYQLSSRYARLKEDSKQLEFLYQAERLATKYDDSNLLAAVTCRMTGSLSRSDPEKAEIYIARGEQLFAKLANPSIEAAVDCRRMQAREAASGGDVDKALAYMFEAKAVLDAHPAQAVDIRGPVLGYIAHLYFNESKFKETIDYLDETLSLLESAGRGNSVGYLRVASNKAVTLSSIGQMGESLAAWENIVSRLEGSGYAQRGASGWLGQYGEALARAGQLDKAEQMHVRGLELSKQLNNKADTAYHQLGLGRVALKRNEYSEALTWLEKAQEHYGKEENLKRGTARSTRVLMARVHRSQGNWDVALEMVNSLLRDVGYPEAERGRGLLSAVIEATSLYQDMGDYAQAEIYAADVIKRIRKRAVGDPLRSVDVGRAYVHRAEIRASSGQISAALEDLDIAIPVLTETLGSDHKETVAAQELKSSL